MIVIIYNTAAFSSSVFPTRSPLAKSGITALKGLSSHKESHQERIPSDVKAYHVSPTTGIY